MTVYFPCCQTSGAFWRPFPTSCSPRRDRHSLTQGQERERLPSLSLLEPPVKSYTNSKASCFATRHKVVQLLSKIQSSTSAKIKQKLAPNSIWNSFCIAVNANAQSRWRRSVICQALESCGFSVKDAKALMPKEPSLQLYRLPFYSPFFSYFLIAFSRKCLK